MKINWDFVVGIAYIAFFTGLAVAEVGQMSGPNMPFGWDMPPKILLLIALPFAVGFKAGRAQGKKGDERE